MAATWLLIKNSPGLAWPGGLSNVHRTGCVCVCVSAATSHRCQSSQCQW